MAVFTCKMCGGDLAVDHNESVAVCEYCGTKQTIPRLDDEKRVNLYARANHFRRNNEYDKAMSIYEQILSEDSHDAEAYWSIVLCRYGIEYVKDPLTKKRVPTINRTQFTSIFLDEDYKSAISNADPAQVEIYKDEAERIDEIQKGILDISRKEKPFDVFISYKETDEQGKRTRDSVLAGQIYHELVREGFKTFFAKITLEDKLGEEYEPYIFAALNSAKVMVVVGTKPEYFNAVWVKNEWSRYLKLIKDDGKKHLIPAYRDMDPYDLPEEFAYLQALDMAKLGFMPDLIRGVKKLIGAPTGTKAAVVDSSKSTNTIDIEPLMERGRIALEDKEWDKAIGFYERVLDREPKFARAYLGEALAEKHYSSIQAFVDYLVKTEASIPLTPEEYAFPIDQLREKLDQESVDADDEFKKYVQDIAVYYGKTTYPSEKGYWVAKKTILQAFNMNKKIVKAMKYDTDHEIKDFQLLDQTMRILDYNIQMAEEKGEDQRKALQQTYADYIVTLINQIHSEKENRVEIKRLKQSIEDSNKKCNEFDDALKSELEEMHYRERQLDEIGKNILRIKTIKTIKSRIKTSEELCNQIGVSKSQEEERLSELSSQLSQKNEEYERVHRKTIAIIGTPLDEGKETDDSSVQKNESSGSDHQKTKKINRLRILLKHKDWEAASEYCDKVLLDDPSNDDALLGKLLCEVKINRKVDLINSKEPLSDYPEYSNILRYGGEELVTELESYNDLIIARNEETKEQKRIEEEYARVQEEKKKAEEQLQREMAERRRAQAEAARAVELERQHQKDTLDVQQKRSEPYRPPKKKGSCLGTLMKGFMITVLVLLIFGGIFYVIDKKDEGLPTASSKSSVRTSTPSSNTATRPSSTTSSRSVSVRKEEEALEYNIDDSGEITITGYKGKFDSLTIPSEIDDHVITKVAKGAFENCVQLKDIILFADIVEFGESCFKGCINLESISIPNETTVIGAHAFEGCINLEDVFMFGDPDIGEYAFKDCTKLGSISISSGTKIIGAHAFENCSLLDDIFFFGGERIKEYAFANCEKITSISIPSEMKVIEPHAFDNCTRLSSITVWPDTLEIAEDAFSNCPKLDDSSKAEIEPFYVKMPSVSGD